MSTESEKEPNLIKAVWDIYSADFRKGSISFSRQLDTGTGKVVDLCMDDKQECPFYDGVYVTHGITEPVGELSRFDANIGAREQLGFCRIQKDAVRIGPFILFDKKRIRPTPKD